MKLEKKDFPRRIYLKLEARVESVKTDENGTVEVTYRLHDPAYRPGVLFGVIASAETLKDLGSEAAKTLAANVQAVAELEVIHIASLGAHGGEPTPGPDETARFERDFEAGGMFEDEDPVSG